jgi:hypothetical protein
MQLFVIARANKDRLERWINDVTAQYVPHEFEPGRRGPLQIAVRPIQLLEIAFPESQKDEVLKIVRPCVNHKPRFVKILRRILGLEELKDSVENVLFYRVCNDDVAITAIGIKKDEYRNGVEQI